MEPNEPIEFTPPADLRVTNVALGPELADENGRTTLKLVYLSPASEESDEEDEEEAEDEDEGKNVEPIATVLCSLTPGKVRERYKQLEVRLIGRVNRLNTLS